MRGFKIEAMDRRKVVFQMLPAMLLVGAVTACAGNEDRESTGEYIDDTAITTKVKAKILDDKELSAFEINVETFKGVVQLSGFVDTADEKIKAGAVAGSVEGVVRVENKITVK